MRKPLFWKDKVIKKDSNVSTLGLILDDVDSVKYAINPVNEITDLNSAKNGIAYCSKDAIGNPFSDRGCVSLTVRIGANWGFQIINAYSSGSLKVRYNRADGSWTDWKTITQG